MSIYKGEKLISGPASDWTGAVKLNHAEIYSNQANGYTAPSNGMIVGWFKFNNRIAVLDLNINNITVARSSVTNNAVNSEGNVQCPVNKGDHIHLKASLGTIAPNDIEAKLYFVPWK